MSEPFVVDEIVITTGSYTAQQDPYGQGAAWVSADVRVTNSEVVESLRQAAQQRSIVTVCCVKLEVVGSVGWDRIAEGDVHFTLAVLEIHYTKPG